VCCILLQSVALCCSVLQCVAVHYNALQCVAVRCSLLQCVAANCSMLQCVTMRCSASQCVPVRGSVLQCVVACCTVLQSSFSNAACNAHPSHRRLAKCHLTPIYTVRARSRTDPWHLTIGTTTHCNTLQHTATHCSTLQHTATHCSTLTLAPQLTAHNHCDVSEPNYHFASRGFTQNQ